MPPHVHAATALPADAPAFKPRAAAPVISRDRTPAAHAPGCCPPAACTFPPPYNSAHPSPRPADSKTQQDWRVRYRNRTTLCVLRAPPHPLESRSDMGPFPFIDLPVDLMPMIAGYLHDCELARLSGTCKALYRACMPEFRYRVERIITGSKPVDKSRPRKAVVEAHDESETLHEALGNSAAMAVKLDHVHGFPRAVVKGCGIM
ncbi:hypothetical protein DFJ74DRAFT_644740 [Hyaloraphidium curvatum]|nr:hypothetical protein DFJ74DRAFT_644740 [Hyaloraphidium curvatum]